MHILEVRLEPPLAGEVAPADLAGVLGRAQVGHLHVLPQPLRPSEALLAVVAEDLLRDGKTLSWSNWTQRTLMYLKLI